jgi:uncharacterized membrane protein
MGTPARLEAERIARAASNVRWWPSAVAFLVLGGVYALVSERLTLGPPWWLLALTVLVVPGAWLLRSRGLMRERRMLAFGMLAVTSVAISVSVVYLVQGLLSHRAEAPELLSGGGLLWVANVLTFSLWYWEVDGGGPTHRHLTLCGSSDFAFPQRVLGDDSEAGWVPDYLDYLFLAFNTSTAFSPTDTMVLARRAKVLMMYQSVLSLVSVVVLVARAINAL